MSMLDYSDMIFMHASLQYLHPLNTVYHVVLRFITNKLIIVHTVIVRVLRLDGLIFPPTDLVTVTQFQTYS